MRFPVLPEFSTKSLVFPTASEQVKVERMMMMMVMVVMVVLVMATIY